MFESDLWSPTRRGSPPLVLNALLSAKKQDLAMMQGSGEFSIPAVSGQTPSFTRLDELSMLTDTSESASPKVPTTGKYAGIFAKYDKQKKEDREFSLRQWDTWLHKHGLATPLRSLYGAQLTEEEAEMLEYDVDSDTSDAEREATIKSQKANGDFRKRAQALRLRLRNAVMLIAHKRVLSRLNDSDPAQLQESLRATVAAAFAAQDEAAAAAAEKHRMSSADIRKALDRSPSSSRASSRAGSPAGTPRGFRSRSSSVASLPLPPVVRVQPPPLQVARSQLPPQQPQAQQQPQSQQPQAQHLQAQQGTGLARRRTHSTPYFLNPSSAGGPATEHPSPLLQQVLKRSPSKDPVPHPPAIVSAMQPLTLSQLGTHSDQASHRRGLPSPAHRAASPPKTVAAPPTALTTALGTDRIDELWRLNMRAPSDESHSTISDSSVDMARYRLDILRDATDRALQQQKQQHSEHSDNIASRIGRLRGMLQR